MENLKFRTFFDLKTSEICGKSEISDKSEICGKSEISDRPDERISYLQIRVQKFRFRPPLLVQKYLLLRENDRRTL